MKPFPLLGKGVNNDVSKIQFQTPAQVFSCEICEILKNTLFYRTPPVAAFDDNIKLGDSELSESCLKDFYKVFTICLTFSKNQHVLKTLRNYHV